MNWQAAPAVQRFGLPGPMMMRLIQRPANPAMYMRLRDASKWFFERNPIIFADLLDGKRLCSGANCDLGIHFCKHIDIDKARSSVVVTGKVLVKHSKEGGALNTYLNSYFMKLYNDQIMPLEVQVDLGDNHYLMFEDLIEVSTQAITVDIAAKIIRLADNDAVFVTIDEIASQLPAVQNITFMCDFQSVVAGTFQNLAGLPNLQNLQTVKLYGLPGSIDLDELFTFIVAFPNAKQIYQFQNDYNPTPDEHERLDGFIDLLLFMAQTGINIMIKYNHQDAGKLAAMKKLMEDD